MICRSRVGSRAGEAAALGCLWWTPNPSLLSTSAYGPVAVEQVAVHEVRLAAAAETHRCARSAPTTL